MQDQKKKTQCPTCDGKGYQDSTYHDMNHPVCSDCKGSGMVASPPVGAEGETDFSEAVKKACHEYFGMGGPEYSEIEMHWRAAIEWYKSVTPPLQDTGRSAKDIVSDYFAIANPDEYLTMTVQFSDLVSLLVYAQSKQQQEWVSVEDRLPEVPDEWYLIAVKNKNKEGGIYLIDLACYNSDGVWLKSNTWEKVTHWMPLPTPPKH